MPNVIDLLKARSRPREGPLPTVRRGRDTGRIRKKQGLAEAVCAALEIHTTLEEELFYPAMKRKDRSRRQGPRRRGH